ncbi:hypothetical protein HN51_027321 [Arachis hypogaea]|uniref:RING-type domain-containing protein n=2 Tax=Arachis TaxID=3817 RepID=A0A445BNI1_ARAHY|nr:uncharacterized protein LOC107464519 [Arachis duranensis]XP_025618185.1 uncharacterized protein LOC112710244 [Arachis hypogaea]QHO33648.1 E3 ubiquitin-protein ligase [Arachis hypogaea]RYR40243.1 hypothetical protein Ahy_A09g045963 [Arachis hypogaea]
MINNQNRILDTRVHSKESEKEMATEEEEVVAEVEAVEAVYGTDCVLLQSFPPHFRISVKPRTADVSFEQFVEAIVDVKAGPQYPKEPPSINLVDSKGLDEQRQKYLLNYIRSKANELSPSLMLVALCEEAAEKLSTMNHPDGDCPLCLFPLVPEDQQSTKLPFMKLMSCFHCFHSECIIQWWNWLQTSKEADSAYSASATTHPNRDKNGKLEEGVGNCPVCRKPFDGKDLDHVLDLVDSHSSQLRLENDEAIDEENLLQSEDEIIRRKKFETILNLQKENSGLIESKRDIVIVPGMYLPQSLAASSSTLTKESDEQQEKDSPAVAPGKHEPSSNRPSSSGHRNFGARKQRAGNPHSNSTVRNPRKPAQQWVRRDNPNRKQ